MNDDDCVSRAEGELEGSDTLEHHYIDQARMCCFKGARNLGARELEKNYARVSIEEVLDIIQEEQKKQAEAVMKFVKSKLEDRLPEPDNHGKFSRDEMSGALQDLMGGWRWKETLEDWANKRGMNKGFDKILDVDQNGSLSQ